MVRYGFLIDGSSDACKKSLCRLMGINCIHRVMRKSDKEGSEVGIVTTCVAQAQDGRPCAGQLAVPHWYIELTTPM